MDAIPGNPRQREQARQTQINFSRQCPVISQARSAVEAIKGDQAAARETQKQFGHFLVGVVNGVPVVGHISGGIHHAVGDKAGGDRAMKEASRTTAVMAGGIGGIFIGGPVGAIGLGIGAGVAMDSTITAIDTAVHWKEDKKVRTFGIAEPFRDPTNVGKWFDAGCGLVMDGVTGLGAGNLAKATRARYGTRGSPVDVVENRQTGGAIRPSAPSMAVFIKVSKGVLHFMKEKAKDVCKSYVKSKLKDDVLVILRHAGDKIYVWIKDEIVHTRDKNGNIQVLQDGHVYTVTHSTGRVEEILDKIQLDNIESIFQNLHGCIESTDDESSDVREFSLGD